jgi:hypothetical protein
VRWFVLVGCGGAASEETKCVLGRRTGLGGIDKQSQPGVSRQFHGLEGQVQVPNDGVVKRFGAGAVEADVWSAPASAEGLAAGGKLADEVAQPPVIGIRLPPAETKL